MNASLSGNESAADRQEGVASRDVSSLRNKSVNRSAVERFGGGMNRVVDQFVGSKRS